MTQKRHWRFALLLAGLVQHACAVTPAPKPPPIVPPQPAPAAIVRTVATTVWTEGGHPIVGATCTIDQAPAPRGPANADGYVAWDGIEATRRDLQLTCAADGFNPFGEHRVLATSANEELGPVTLLASHFDPSILTLDELAGMLKGAMWTSRLNLPFGPRPGQDSNTLPMAFYELYSHPDRARMLKHYHDEQGYTAAVTGPVTGNDCYHGLYPCRQRVPTQVEWDAYLDTLQEWWDNGTGRTNRIAPVYFGKPDGGENDPATLAALDALERQPRAQKLIRIVIEPGWEPSGTKYGWKNEVYVRMLKRGADNFPHALRGLHTVADLDAPIGGDDDPVAQMPNNKAEAWRRVVGLMHFWAVQIDGYVHGGSSTPTPPFLVEFKKLWGDYNRRFAPGGMWSFGSAWPDGRPILVGYAEGASYGDFWWNWPESIAQDLGDLAIDSGAAFCLDGCRKGPRR